jgi:hypothetical protein
MLATAAGGVVLVLLGLTLLPAWIVRWFSIPAARTPLVDAAIDGSMLSLTLAALEIVPLAAVVLLLARYPRRAAGPLLAGSDRGRSARREASS